MTKKYSLDDFDSEMEKIIEDFEQMPAVPPVSSPTVQPVGLNPTDVKSKLLQTARQRAARILGGSTTGSLI